MFLFLIYAGDSKLATRMAVNLPSTYLQYPGNLQFRSVHVYRCVENYLLAIHAEGDDWPDIRKRATLLHYLGTEVKRIFYTLPNTGMTYASTLTALRVNFVPQVNTIAE